LDGSGYPDGLKNAQVPLLAQIIGIVDVFDALTTDRPYHTAVSHDEALGVVAGEASKGWRDRSLVDAFSDVVGAG
jgi:putative two-component system response regulator